MCRGACAIPHLAQDALPAAAYYRDAIILRSSDLPDGAMRVDETSDGQRVALHVDQPLEICLPENRGTGYRWVLAPAVEGPCALVNDVYEPPDGPPGRPGLRCWKFKTTRAGQGRIDLAYVRPWQQGQPPARTFTLYFHVST